MRRISKVLYILALVFLLTGFILIGVMAYAENSLKLEVFQGTYFYAGLNPTSTTVSQGQSVTFTVTIATNSQYVAFSEATYTWKVDGNTINSVTSSQDFDSFSYTFNSAGSHTVVCAISIMGVGYEPPNGFVGLTDSITCTGTVTVSAGTAPTPAPTSSTQTPSSGTSPAPSTSLSPAPTVSPTLLSPPWLTGINRLLIAAIGVISILAGFLFIWIARRIG